MAGVKDLDLSGPLTDVGPLARLGGLHTLRLDDTLVTDVSPLAALEELDDLGITGGPLADVTPFAELPLRRLFVYDTQVADITSLAGMPLLQVLGLAGCPVRALSAAETMPSPHHVNLNRCEETELGGLPEGLPQVTFEQREGSSTSTGFSDPAGGQPSAVQTLGDTAELLARFRATSDYGGRSDMWAALLATRDPEAVQEFVRDARHGSYTLRGLLHRDGIGDVPFAANPWDITDGDDWPVAFERVWAPIAPYAPHLLDILRDRTLALALLTDDEGRPALAYVAWDRRTYALGPLGPLPALGQFADPDHNSYPTIVLGTAPRRANPATDVPLLAGPVPRPVRDFWSVHAALGRLAPRLDSTMPDWFDGDLPQATEQLRGLPPDRFVVGAGSTDFEAYLFDLDVLDGSGHPTVAGWWFKEGDKVGGHASFWDWANEEGPRLVFD